MSMKRGQMHNWGFMRTSFVAALALVLAAQSRVEAAIGDPIGGEFQVNAYSTGAQGEPAVAPDGAGGFVVVWHSDGSPTDDQSFSVQVRRYSATGVPVGDEFQANTYTPFPQLEPAVSPDGTGGFVVVWQSGGSAGGDNQFTSVQGQRFSSAGAPVGGEFQVNTYTTLNQASPAVAPDGAGGFVVVWRSDGGSGSDTDGSSVQAQRFDAAGAPVGGEFQVNSYTTDDQYDVAVSSDGAGGFVVVWASDGGAGTDRNFASIQAQRFDANGPVGTEFQVNSYTTSAQRLPSVTSLEAGGFVVAWQSDASSESDRSYASIHAQRFSAAGAPVGGQFQVNTYTTNAQDAPSVGRDGGGGFVVIWESEGGLGNDQGSFSAQARRFDANGVALGSEVQVNTYVPSDQRGFAVGPDGSGGFVVLWDSLGSNGNDNNAQSIQARRFVGPNSPTTSTITTTTLAGGNTSTTLSSGGANGERLTGKKLQLRAKADRPEKSRLAMRSKDRRLTIGRGNQSLDDPVLHAGALTVASGAGGFGATQVLTGRWKYVGKLGRNKGYKWKSKSGPIRSLVLKRGKGAKLVGRGAELGFDLDNDPNPVRVSVRTGEHFYCLEFGGAKVKFTPNKRFRAKKAGAPTTCP
jgi:hypothetical protein